jgi:glutathione synthase/RimK-type ligase-like ATP-grasp enzyme
MKRISPIIGIHDSPGSYSDRWILWCQENGLPFKRINCLASDVIEQCAGLKAVLWHWIFLNLDEMLVARQIIAALEHGGTLVYPNMATCWHYDDKVGQKYLLESVGAPLVPTWVFTDPAQAKAWIAQTSWPKVFKLRCGAGSNNVRLVRSQAEAEGICRQAFGAGFAAMPGYLDDARTRLRNTLNWTHFCAKVRRAPQSILTTLKYRRHGPRQRGYVYFQEFLPGNDFDTRVTIIGNRAFGATRRNRPNDFRASGSGEASFDPRTIGRRCVEVAFQVADKLRTQSLGLDFLFDADHQPKICEVSYCSVIASVSNCPGYWDRDYNWHEGHFWPQDLILQDLLAELEITAPRLAVPTEA